MTTEGTKTDILSQFEDIASQLETLVLETEELPDDFPQTTTENQPSLNSEAVTENAAEGINANHSESPRSRQNSANLTETVKTDGETKAEKNETSHTKYSDDDSSLSESKDSEENHSSTLKRDLSLNLQEVQSDTTENTLDNVEQMSNEDEILYTKIQDLPPLQRVIHCTKNFLTLVSFE
jgi:hypothetical protein